MVITNLFLARLLVCRFSYLVSATHLFNYKTPNRSFSLSVKSIECFLTHNYEKAIIRFYTYSI